jgi:hypothetical protein
MSFASKYFHIRPHNSSQIVQPRIHNDLFLLHNVLNHSQADMDHQPHKMEMPDSSQSQNDRMGPSKQVNIEPIV